MNRILDIDRWERRDHFNFYKDFSSPFFGVTVEVDCTIAHAFCKQNGTSFFLHYLHKSLIAANAVEEFKYRIQNDDVIVYETVNVSATISRPNGTFGFSYIDYLPDYPSFEVAAQSEIDRVRNGQGLKPDSSSLNVIHFSSVPWINFTGLTHARNDAFADSCPKISIGKMTTQNGIKTMPVAIHAHHALMDGYQVGQFIDQFQELMDVQKPH